MGIKNPRTYTAEFRNRAISLALIGKESLKTLSEKLDIPVGTLSGWVSIYKRSVDNTPSKNTSLVKIENRKTEEKVSVRYGNLEIQIPSFTSDFLKIVIDALGGKDAL